MYLTAVSAAWRYSGKVTGPDSRLSRPTVIGVPVALLGVPRAALGSGVAVLVAFAALPLLGVLLEEDELLLPQAATNAALAASEATTAIRCLVTFTGLSLS